MNAPKLGYNCKAYANELNCTHIGLMWPMLRSNKLCAPVPTCHANEPTTTCNSTGKRDLFVIGPTQRWQIWLEATADRREAKTAISIFWPNLPTWHATVCEDKGESSNWKVWPCTWWPTLEPSWEIWLAEMEASGGERETFVVRLGYAADFTQLMADLDKISTRFKSMSAVEHVVLHTKRLK